MGHSSTMLDKEKNTQKCFYISGKWGHFLSKGHKEKGTKRLEMAAVGSKEMEQEEHFLDWRLNFKWCQSTKTCYFSLASMYSLAAGNNESCTFRDLGLGWGFARYVWWMHDEESWNNGSNSLNSIVQEKNRKGKYRVEGSRKQRSL